MRPGLVSGSTVTPIPTDAVTGFASASTLLRRSRPVDSTNGSGLSVDYDLQSSGRLTEQEPKDLGTDQKKPPPAFKKPRVIPETRLRGVQERDSNFATAPTANIAEDADILPPKKSRKKKSKNESESQTTIKKAKVTKPGSVVPRKKAVGPVKKAKEVVSAPFQPPASTQEEDLAAKKEFRDLCLEKAITRRREWTPCEDTAPDPAPKNDSETSVGPALLNDIPLANEPPIAGFGNLLGDFGFAQKEDSLVVISESTRHGNGAAIIKRRKIELVDGVPAPRVSEEPKRRKSPKKKPQTVTEKATAPFASIRSMAAPSLLQYFGTPTVASVVPAGGATDNSDTPGTVGRKSQVKKTATSKPKTSKAKRAVQKQPILLSPESAMKNAENQELVFGTSSQLVRDESPSLIRDIQQALKESESTVEQKQPTLKGYDFLDLPSGRPRSSHVRAILASKSLWSAASRDIDGSLIETERVNLADTPKPIRAITEVKINSKIADSSEPKLDQESGTLSQAGDIVSTAPNLSSNDAAELQQESNNPDPIMPRSVAEAALRARPKSKSPVKKKSLAKPSTDQMPNYEGFTDIQLKKKIASYGFKPIKKRETMIKQLERCWESERSLALREVPANVNPPQPAADMTSAEMSKHTSPSKKRGRPPKNPNLLAVGAGEAGDVPQKKPRGRPKKDPTNPTTPPRKQKRKAVLSEALVSAADEEIYDSSPPTPSPPRRRSPPKSPGQLQLSQPLEIQTTNATAAIEGKDRARLFSQITKAVTTFPPTHDDKNLTWYEKMLMYDPIVLEDLTVWLNREGLGRVDEDDEVSPEIVKQWCEGQSICCVWKENLRGGTRGRW